MFKPLLACACIALSMPASAAFIESENNGAIGSAQALNLNGSGTVDIAGSITTNPIDGLADYDYFKLGSFAAGGVISVSTASNFDPIIGLYNSLGNLVVIDDDSGPGLDSLFTFNVATADVYTLVIRGYGSDFSNNPFSLTPGNPLGSRGSYTATVVYRNAVPEPSSIALSGLALGALVLARRRKA